MPLFRRKPAITADQIFALQDRADGLLGLSSLTNQEREVLEQQGKALNMAHFALVERHD